MPIKRLSEQLANKIAAGEVIERPGSVIKELLENALDAEATSIVVEVKRGGIELIRVTDNGIGIACDELGLVFERHATSKLSRIEDLDSLQTLGFRGEALSSISVVSRVKLTTREITSDIGSQIVLDWGGPGQYSKKGCSVGTTIEICDLFQNVPARRKFLKSHRSEVNTITHAVSRIALSFPSVAIILRVDDKDAFRSLGTGNLQETIASIYKVDIASNMLKVQYADDSGRYKVNGYISPPHINRSNRSQVTFLVNHRWIRSRLLSVALDDAYRGLLPQGRHPITILDLSVPTEELDINVHPTKREVKFRLDNIVFSVLQRAVREVLIEDSPVPKFRVDTTLGSSSRSTVDTMGFQAPLGERLAVTKDVSQKQEPLRRVYENASNIRIIGQASKKFIIGEGTDGIFLIDQHAAHECVLYEKLRGEMELKGGSSQTLLEPVIVEFPPEHLGLEEDVISEMRNQGFELDIFGDSAYLLRAIPSIFGDSDPTRGFLDIIESLTQGSPIKDKRELIAASIACHGSVRAGHTLSLEEMTEVVELLGDTNNPHVCPHGRPTTLHISSVELDKQFRRR
ncbi:MAG: DNA mismatch repair protein MutL [Dehalococcoidia bacterium]|nr:DNA mismatch repair protein MutL [Dehalococcoidia bacterium]